MANPTEQAAHRSHAESIVKAFNRSALSSTATGYTLEYRDGYYIVKLKIKGYRRLYLHSKHKI